MASALLMTSGAALLAREVERVISPRTLSDRDVEIFEKPDASTADAREWFTSVRIELVELLQLAPNWDSFGAPSIAERAATLALDLLYEASPPGTPPPSVVPASHGGVQLEWHRGQMDIEVEVWPSRRIELYVADLDTGEEYELPIGSEVKPLFWALQSLITRIS